jgi:hypothetical protein
MLLSSLFVPSRAILRGKTEICEAVEATLDVEVLVTRAVNGVESHDIESEV